MRLDTAGLWSCPGEHRWICCDGLWRCEHREVEQRLGLSVDPRWPNDLAIGYALQVEAEYREDVGVDHIPLLIAASNEGHISPQRRNELLQIEHANRASELASAAFEIATERQAWSGLPDDAGLRAVPDRRWRDELNDREIALRRRLEETRHNEGLSEEDAALKMTLTEPQPAAEIDWERLPSWLREAAERRVQDRGRRARGEMPRSRRVSSTDRHRLATGERPSFREQLGPLATERDPFKIAHLVRQLRQHAKRLSLLGPDHDRRRKPRH